MNDEIERLFSLAGKNAIVTGATGFFGKTFSEALLGAGANVILFGRSDKTKTITEAYCDKYGKDRATCHIVDLHDEDAFRSALLSACSSAPSIDILINNAYEFSRETGFNDPSGRFERISKAQWMQGLEAGVYWHALATQVVAEKMKAQGRGSIINISSMYSIVSPDPSLYEGTQVFNPPTYSAGKAAINALTRYTASFYGQSGVRCNALLPGAFPNVGGDTYNSPKDTTILKRLEQRTILGRTGRPDDLRGALIYLASDASLYMTGQMLVVDGGWTVR